MRQADTRKKTNEKATAVKEENDDLKTSFK